MDVYVHTHGGVDAALDLAHWVAADPAAGPLTTVAGSRTAPGSMAGTTEVLQFAVGNAIALGALLVSIAQWRRARPERPTVRITTDAEGVSVTVESDDPAALAAVVRELGGA